ncbi:MAG: EAL domain-containing protein [Gammaproteobacteria bacterium]
MSQTLIATLNEKMQDAILPDFNESLFEEKAGHFTGRYRGFDLDSVFQPIRAGKGHAVAGYEALLRPSIGRLLPVETKFAFRYVGETGGLVIFDRLCRTLHLLNFLSFGGDSDLLFINVHPALLNRVDAHGKIFEGIVHSLSVPPNRVVIELEESIPEDHGIVDKALKNFRERGFKIAISDFGKEKTYVKRSWQIAPDFVKLHGDLIREAANHDKACRVLPKIVDLIHESGGEAVIQGIETPELLEIAEQTGAEFFQGFGLFRPEPAGHWLESKRAAASF